MKRVADRVSRTWWKAILSALGALGASSSFACAYGVPEYGAPVPVYGVQMDCASDQECEDRNPDWYCDKSASPDGGVGQCRARTDGGQ